MFTNWHKIDVERTVGNFVRKTCLKNCMRSVLLSSPPHFINDSDKNNCDNNNNNNSNNYNNDDDDDNNSNKNYQSRNLAH